MLTEHTLFGIRDRENDAIERLKMFCPPEGYYFADSFGKDSTVVRDLPAEKEVSAQQAVDAAGDQRHRDSRRWGR